jgi:hypothetical protein
LAVSAEEYSCYDDFLMARFNKGLCLLQSLFGRLAVNIGAGFGYDTIAAVSVAAVLNL